MSVCRVPLHEMIHDAVVDKLLLRWGGDTWVVCHSSTTIHFGDSVLTGPKGISVVAHVVSARTQEKKRLTERELPLWWRRTPDGYEEDCMAKKYWVVIEGGEVGGTLRNMMNGEASARQWATDCARANPGKKFLVAKVHVTVETTAVHVDELAD